MEITEMLPIIIILMFLLMVALVIIVVVVIVIKSKGTKATGIRPDKSIDLESRVERLEKEVEDLKRGVK